MLKSPWLNNWKLLWVIMAPISIWLGLSAWRADLSNGEGVSAMISISVRCAVPWLFIAFAASSVQVLRPGAFSLWLVRNRKIFGLCFAAAMAWQAFFILWLVTIHRDYYVSEVYLLRDVIEGLIGYGFLIAMTLTSFMPMRKRLKPKQWKWLHKIGIYSLWMYAFSVYWWALFYYPAPRPVDYLFYAMGLTAWGLRVAVWRKKQLIKARQQEAYATVQPVYFWAGIACGLLGLTAAVTGGLWQPPSEQVLLGHQGTQWAEWYLPYWPFEPFLPLLLMGIGTWLTTLTSSTAPHPAAV